MSPAGSGTYALLAPLLCPIPCLLSLVTNTFNIKERVYSRAIAFSNCRCSVPLESALPNIIAMYSELVYTYIAPVLDLSLTPPSLTLLCVAPYVLSAGRCRWGGGGGEKLGGPAFPCSVRQVKPNSQAKSSVMHQRPKAVNMTNSIQDLVLQQDVECCICW